MDTNLDNNIGFNFYKGWRVITAMYKATFGNEVSPQNILVLNYCKAHERSQIKDIVKHLDLDASAVSSLVSRMEKRGWLSREHGEKDRRNVFVRLTKEGQNYQESIKEESDNLTDKISEGMSENEINSLIDIVNRIEANRSKNEG
jgi:DNA-binding MarR family transcriptional regulator